MIKRLQKRYALSEQGAKDLVKGCLELDVEKRWTVHDILSCSWLQGCVQLYEHVPREWLAES